MDERPTDRPGRGYSAGKVGVWRGLRKTLLYLLCGFTRKHGGNPKQSHVIPGSIPGSAHTARIDRIRQPAPDWGQQNRRDALFRGQDDVGRTARKFDPAVQAQTCFLYQFLGNLRVVGVLDAPEPQPFFLLLQELQDVSSASAWHGQMWMPGNRRAEPILYGCTWPARARNTSRYDSLQSSIDIHCDD